MRRLLPIILLAALVAGSCADDADDEDTAAPSDVTDTVLVFGAEGDNLHVYSGDPPFDSQMLITNADDDPDGLDINGQVCFFDDDGTKLVAGEDTDQPDPPPAWGIIAVEGDEVGELRASQVGRLTPTFVDGDDNAENYGCGILSDGRVVTSDVGEQAVGDGTGQLILWFPPFDTGLDGAVGAVSYCKLDVGIPTAGGIAIDDDDIYLTSARSAPNASEHGVWRYSGPFPTDDTADGGCGATDDTGAPLADDVAKELFITAGDHDLATPSSVVITDDGDFIVSSVFTGVINRYDSTGAFAATLLAPAEGEAIDETSFSTGTPMGLGLGPDGTLYYADIGIVWPEDRDLPGPGPDSGSVRRITFVDGEPQPPETMASGLAFPDGIGVLVVRR